MDIACQRAAAAVHGSAAGSAPQGGIAAVREASGMRGDTKNVLTLQSGMNNLQKYDPHGPFEPLILASRPLVRA